MNTATNSIDKSPRRVTRRTLMRQGLAGAVAFAGGWAWPRITSAARDRYQFLDSDKFLGPVEVLATVDDEQVFTEGPAVELSTGRLFFTNVPVSKILIYDPKSRELSVFREQSNKTNGLMFDSQGRLLCCEGDAGRVTRTNMQSGAIEVLAETFNGFPFASPNDLCQDAQGRTYFTSRPGVTDPAQGNVNAVYRIDANGSVEQILKWPQVHMPNGIAVSPDNKTLYVIEAHPDADHHRDIRAYDLTEAGRAENERVLINFYPGRSGDGMCLDSQGNLYVAAGLHALRNTSETLDTRPGIHVISPAGRMLAFRETPEDTITNCTFGGADRQTLYVTCGTKILGIRSYIPG